MIEITAKPTVRRTYQFNLTLTEEQLQRAEAYRRIHFPNYRTYTSMIKAILFSEENPVIPEVTKKSRKRKAVSDNVKR